RHHDVEEDQVGLEFQRHVHAFAPVAGGKRRVARGRENCLDDQQYVVVVVNNQNFFGRHYAVTRSCPFQLSASRTPIVAAELGVRLRYWGFSETSELMPAAREV